jgi:hypothetical protein
MVAVINWLTHTEFLCRNYMFQINSRENRWGNQEWTTQKTLATQDTGWRHKKKNKKQKKPHTQHRQQKDEQHRTQQKLEMNPGARQGWAVPASYKTPSMVLM